MKSDKIRRGQMPWNKNLTKETNSILKSISEKLSGKNKIKFTNDDISKIIKMYSTELMSIKEIGKMFNCSRSPVDTILRENNVKITQSERQKIMFSCGKLKIWNIGLKGVTSQSEPVRKQIGDTKRRLYAEGKIVTWNRDLKGKGICKSTPGSFKKGHITPQEVKEKIASSRRGQHPSEETIEKIRIGVIASKTPAIRKKKSEDAKRCWNNPEWKENQMKIMLGGLKNRPTSFEKKIIDLCLKYNLPFIYTGDGRMLVNLKNPDFINEQKKVVIEVFFSRFKILSFGSIENYMKQRALDFEVDGYKVVFLSEKEVLDKDWERKCLTKINGVMGAGI